MSRRYSQNNKQHQHQQWVTTTDRNNNNNNNKNPSKSNNKFIPKSQNPNPTFSNSLRQSFSNQSGDSTTAPSGSSSDVAAVSSSRIRMGDKGDWVAASGDKSEGNFVNYLPQDEAVAAGLGAEQGGMDPVESQRVVDVLNRELSRLLRLNSRDFWREVASDTSLDKFLDSFLKFRSRWYDFPYRGIKGLLAGVIVGELELSRRVFMVLYRLSSNRDPGARAADSLSSKDHAVLLQERKLLDLPKLFDICAIYGHENEELTRVLVENALKAQPGIHNDLFALMSHFLGIVHTMHERCTSSLEVLFSSGTNEDHGPLKMDYLDVMDFINDAVVSMDAFVTAYRPAAVIFSCPVEMSWENEELLPFLAKLHDILIPSLQQGFHIILKGDDGMKLNIAVSLKMLSMRLVNFGWKLLDICYLSGEVFEAYAPILTVSKMFPAKVEDPVIRGDILIQTFREINGVLAYSKENQIGKAYLQNLEKNYHIMSRLRTLLNTGWVFIDDEQLQYLSGIMMSSVDSAVKQPCSAPTSGLNNKTQIDEDSAILESKISQIKDLFPDYGKGFLAACLEVYNHNPEEVIQKILEGSLHEDLQSLDTSLETMPMPKSAPTENKKDKGKGKLVESDPLPPPTRVHSSNAVSIKEQQSGPSVSSSVVGRFVRKSNDMPDYTTESRDEKDAARTAALISQYEYEDEYDDSFDDLGYSVAEISLEESDTLNDRITSTVGKSSGSETESSAQTPSSIKWGSRKKPQFYVKDGKNYSYRVAGAVEVANAMEASLVTQSQSELIHGLGRGGNIPRGAVKKLMEYQEQENQSADVDTDGKESVENPRGRGLRGGRGRGRGRGRGGRQVESREEQDAPSDNSQGEGRGQPGNARGRGRGRGGNHYRKDRAMKKHFSGVSGF